jgi:hypothetical protein
MHNGRPTGNKSVQHVEIRLRWLDPSTGHPGFCPAGCHTFGTTNGRGWGTLRQGDAHELVDLMFDARLPRVWLVSLATRMGSGCPSGGVLFRCPLEGCWGDSGCSLVAELEFNLGAWTRLGDIQRATSTAAATSRSVHALRTNAGGQCRGKVGPSHQTPQADRGRTRAVQRPGAWQIRDMDPVASEWLTHSTTRLKGHREASHDSHVICHTRPVRDAELAARPRWEGRTRRSPDDSIASQSAPGLGKAGNQPI